MVQSGVVITIDVMLIANEVVKDLNKGDRQGLLLQLDFEKAYDELNWYSLEFAMVRKILAGDGEVGFQGVFHFLLVGYC